MRGGRLRGKYGLRFFGGQMVWAAAALVGNLLFGTL